MSDRGRMAAALAPAQSARQIFRRFWPIARQNKKLFALGGLALVLAAACDTAMVLLFSRITDRVLRTGDLAAFWQPALWWVGLALIAGVFGFAGQYFTAMAGERFLLALRDRVFGHVQKMSPGFFSQRRRGDLVARLTGDVESVEALVGSGVVQTFTAMVSIVFFAAGALFIRWELALVTFALVPLFTLLARRFARRINSVGRNERAGHGDLTAALEENLANMAVVQAHRREGTEAQRVHEHGRNWMRTKLGLARLGALYSPLVHVLETVCVLVVLGIGAWEISANRMTLGGLFAFAAFLSYLYPPVRGLGQLTLTIAAATTGSARLIELLDTEPAVIDPPHAHDPGRAAGRVEVRDVTFTYPDRTTPALREVSLSVGPGELVAVTGASGAGKSTLAKLLLRFYDPATGSVHLDGVDLRTLPLHVLRREISLLHQETLLWHGTIAENIAYGAAGAGQDQIIAAAMAADAHDFIQRLPESYDTLVGDRGQRLSGGQRQRIAIARTMIANAPVLVLDEPTAGLDPDAALRVIEPLRRLAAGRATILITHDEKLAALAHRTVVLSEGRVTADRPRTRGGVVRRPARADQRTSRGSESFWKPPFEYQ